MQKPKSKFNMYLERQLLDTLRREALRKYKEGTATNSAAREITEALRAYFNLKGVSIRLNTQEEEQEINQFKNK